MTKCYPAVADAQERLKRICRQELTRLYGAVIPEAVEKRLTSELSCILESNMAWSFLVVRDFLIKLDLSPGDIGYRMDLGASYVAYLCGITCVDPIHSDPQIPMESFYGIDGRMKENIDLMLPIEKLEEAIAICGTLEGVGSAILAGESNGHGTDREWNGYSILLIPEGKTIDEFTKLVPSINTIQMVTEKTWRELEQLYKLNLLGLDDVHRGFEEEIQKFAPYHEMGSVADKTKLIGLLWGQWTWGSDAIPILQKDLKKEEIIGNREDIFDYMLRLGFERREAFEIMDIVRKGKARGENRKWEQYRKDILVRGASEAFVQICEQTLYLFSRAWAYWYALYS